MRNTYLTSYFPFISIVLYSFTFAVYFETEVIKILKKAGIYYGMLEFSSKSIINLSVLILFCFFFFMLFSALKLLADTMIEISLLFFSSDKDGHILNQIRHGSIIYLISGIVSLIFAQHLFLIILLFILTTSVYFIYFIYKVSPTLTSTSLIGIIFFHVAFWFTLVSLIIMISLKLYNSIISSLPI